MDISSHCTAVPRCLPIPSMPSATVGYSLPPSLPPSLTKNGRKFEYMRPVNAADDGASSRPLAENTEAMRRWSLGGAYRRVARGPWRAYTRGPAKGFLKNGAAALMREANEIGSGSGACARQGRGVRRRSAPFRSCSSLGFGLLEENRRAVQRLARLCLLCYSNTHVNLCDM